MCKGGEVVECCRYRYSYEDLPRNARETYTKAVLQGKKSSLRYNALVEMHGAAAGVKHSKDQFLGWHRWYILEVEEHLRTQSMPSSKMEEQGWPVAAKCLTHPYWASEYHANNLFAVGIGNTIWSADNLGGPRHLQPPSDGGQCVPDGPFTFPGFDVNGRCLRRSTRGTKSRHQRATAGVAKQVGTSFEIKSARSADFDSWFSQTNGNHGRAHVAVGGDMGRLDTAAHDPIFFMHHSNVDLWWQEWQDMTVRQFNSGSPSAVLHSTGGLTHNDMLNSSRLPRFKGADKDEDFVCIKYASIGTKPWIPGTGGTLIGKVQQGAGGGNRRGADNDSGSNGDVGNDDSSVELGKILKSVADNNKHALPQREAKKALDILKTLPDSFFTEGGVLTGPTVVRMYAPDVDTHMLWLMEQARISGTNISEADARAESLKTLASQLEQPVITLAERAAMSLAELEMSEMLGVSFPGLVNVIKGEQGFDSTAAAELEVALQERAQASAYSTAKSNASSNSSATTATATTATGPETTGDNSPKGSGDNHEFASSSDHDDDKTTATAASATTTVAIDTLALSSDSDSTASTHVSLVAGAISGGLALLLVVAILVFKLKNGKGSQVHPQSAGSSGDNAHNGGTAQTRFSSSIAVGTNTKAMGRIGRIRKRFEGSNIPIREPEVLVASACFMQEMLGKGAFGEVHKGLAFLKESGKSTPTAKPVAIKLLPEGKELDEHKADMLAEAYVAAQFVHPNVVSFVGIIDEPGARYGIVFELCNFGSLDTLVELELVDAFTDVASNASRISAKAALMIAAQVADGMNYLGEVHSFVHRDLACRNVLVSGKNLLSLSSSLLREDGDPTSMVCQVSDFGLSREMKSSEAVDDYYTMVGGKVPIRWSAPESLKAGQYTTATDVWAYGITLYELWVPGEKPYDRLPNLSGPGTDVAVLTAIVTGTICPNPFGDHQNNDGGYYPPGMYDKLMRSCWNPDSWSRPTFAKLSTWAKQQLNRLNAESKRAGIRSIPAPTFPVRGGSVRGGKRVRTSTTLTAASVMPNQSAFPAIPAWSTTSHLANVTPRKSELPPLLPTQNPRITHPPSKLDGRQSSRALPKSSADASTEGYLNPNLT